MSHFFGEGGIFRNLTKGKEGKSRQGGSHLRSSFLIPEPGKALDLDYLLSSSQNPDRRAVLSSLRLKLKEGNNLYKVIKLENSRFRFSVPKPMHFKPQG